MTVSRPVGGVLSSDDTVSGVSARVTIHLCGLPGDIGRASRPTFGLAPSGVCRAARVTPGAGALLPHRFTLTCADDGPGSHRFTIGHRRSAFCGTVLRVAPTGR